QEEWRESAESLLFFGQLIGLLNQSVLSWFHHAEGDDNALIIQQIEARIAAKKAKNWAEADAIRNALGQQGIVLEDKPDGITEWRRA
ncbi:cysteine--tRNA ligase, partial [Pseudomonas aeruginosa]|nr:cysteine--tRNA ligase [Pseudomonas aeruginosa]EKX5697214.1 cysteine--tRNA ligase [Pseudomonas aeruginosa]EKX5715346.1 cysteine--tRNA ligase [Pseudomonas aeruginosa]EKX8174365.1 cysteine--tRNA ligase [Pseudomonas aeruginosa]EKX8255195.1 cysteine--tRNA ligase [Pseudomonas aeruginosa]